MSHYTSKTTKAKFHVDPLVKIYVWRCPDKNCNSANETWASEDGRKRILSSGNELREPMWYSRKCEKCSEVAGRGCCLLEVKPLPPGDEVKGKGNGKAPVDENIEIEGGSDAACTRKLRMPVRYVDETYAAWSDNTRVIHRWSAHDASRLANRARLLSFMAHNNSFFFPMTFTMTDAAGDLG